MATTAERILPDRATYLPQEAQLLRKRIATLYDESNNLFCEARKEQDEIGFAGDCSIIVQFETSADGIAGYASYAQLRIPIPYPSQAIDQLRLWSPYASPDVCAWFTEAVGHSPKTNLYFETLDHLRLLIIDYIENYDALTRDLKSF
jgi:hypothetical protein